MTLTAGTRLGSYEVVAPVGAGGMGEVYRARDTRLGREVAIKVLPDAFARDPERLARFEREAQLLASLNHPNIAAIYGLEEHNGARYLVLEYVPGETLGERLDQASLPVEEALAIGRQIAKALEAAHEKGIVHRDLKPANVKITPEGKVKVLDFGLAKDVAMAAASDISKSPTVTSPAYTRAGVILGTAAYMSPEQARGKPVDKRTDIWAFGCVLFEALTGKKAFGGDSTSDMIAEILKSDVDWNALPASTPAKVRDLLRRCLQKEASQRLRDIGDARLEIEDALAHPLAAAVPEAARGVKPGRLLPVGAAALLAGLLLGGALWHWLGAPKQPSRNVARFVVVLPEANRLNTGDLSSLAISPDGTKLVYVAISGGSTQLFLRPLDRMEATPIPGEGADGPFFSPDGAWVGFFADSKLKKVALSGGSPATLLDAPSPRGAVWASDQTIIGTPDAGAGLLRIPASGGAPQVLTKPNTAKGETSHRLPELLPGGEAVLFTLKGARLRSFDDAQIGVLSLKTGQYKVILEGGTNAHYVPSGHIVYARNGDLLAVPFDLKRLEVTGSPTAVAQGIMEQPATGAASFAFSRDGTLAFAPGGEVASDLNLVWVNRNGEAVAVPAPPRAYQAPDISPDGRRAAVCIMAAYDDIWTYEFGRGTLARVTFSSDTNAGSPLWTPDGKRLVYYSIATGHTDLFWKPADGTGSGEQLFTDPGGLGPTSISPDGKMLAFEKTGAKTGTDIWLVSLDGEKKARPFLESPFDELSAHFSPDGRWVAYASNESGRFEIYVRPYSGEGKWQVSTDGGTEPVWAPNGRELFFRNGDKMMAAAIDTGSGFSAGTPQQLFEGQYERTPGGSDYTVSPDGQRFLMIKGQKSSVRQINVVLNWFDDLKRRVPTAAK